MSTRSLLCRFVVGISLVASAGAQPVPTPRAAGPLHDSTWWKHAVIYEIYPRSFQDSNGDGVGDLNGITQRLDYLQALGIDAIWISPMFPSPQVDFGYDVSDYEAIDPQYGTLADFDRLQTEANRRNIRICLDMVLNHTSDKHRWFIESAGSRSNPKADWYVWNDGIPVGSPGVTTFQKRYEHDGVVPPNNWLSNFGGSAWQWVPARRQFYYHKFYVQQPDLNWRNPAVETAMFETMRFWLRRGVAGYRLDAVPTLFEDPDLRDELEAGAGVNALGDPKLSDTRTSNLPDVHDVMRRMRRVVDEFPGDRVLIGETYLPDTAELNKWYGGTAHDELQLPMDLLVGFHGDQDKLDVDRFRQRILEVETEVNGSQPLLVFDNHDNVRSWDRYGDGAHNKQIAAVLATLLLTSRATALMYYGEELGMPTTTPTRREDVKDPVGITGWPKEKGRDGERTPMQWDTSNRQTGFSTNSVTWLPVPANYKQISVAAERADPDSLLNWHRNLIALRRSNRALRDGGVVMLDKGNDHVLSYLRTAPSGASPVLVAINMTASPQTIHLDLKSAGAPTDAVRTLLTTQPGLKGTKDAQSVTLPPFASWVAAVE